MAVRNQFFTPRYVVQFLSDNTLGRIWYEMRKGETSLVQTCEYMVRQPGKSFAGTDEGALIVNDPDTLTRDQQWRRPIRIPPRLKKDPRDIHVLDPACGSGHFLLYCFALLLIAYQEAWEDRYSPRSEATGRTLREDFQSLDDLKRAAPDMILRHNLHGIDIDPRCAQIAQLALWMRAQRAYQETGVSRADRPIIRRSNIVVAEPMPGDKQLVAQFASTLQPPILGDFFKEIVEEMRLAGEMGSLLPIERKLASTIERARMAYVEQQRHRDRGFLPGLEPPKEQTEIDFSGVNDERFFEQADERILQALVAFVRDTLNGTNARRRLFADNSEQGIAFVELARKKFDVALINPPFGSGSQKAKSEFEKAYPITKNDVLTAFIERAIRSATQRGRIGAITSRTPLFLSTYRKWREMIVTKLAPPVLIADLGVGVLDGAMVETAAYVMEVKTS